MKQLLLASGSESSMPQDAFVFHIISTSSHPRPRGFASVHTHAIPPMPSTWCARPLRRFSRFCGRSTNTEQLPVPGFMSKQEIICVPCWSNSSTCRTRTHTQTH